MNRVRFGTIVWCMLALLSVVLVLTDPMATDDGSGEFVSIRADQRRVFPGLGDFSMSEATIEIQPARGAPVRIVAGTEGHQVVLGEEVLGPADRDAIEGLWSTLRLATTIRGAQEGVSIRGGVAGSLRVRVADKSFTVEFGDPTPGDGGRYANVIDGRESESWVVEPELLWPVTAEPEVWLARQLAQVEVDEVTSISWADALRIQRGEDGIWRVEAGAAPAMLSAEAVESRLERLLTTQLEPIVPRGSLKETPWAPWLLLGVGTRESNLGLSVGGACPGQEKTARLVDRGPGVVGCVPVSLIDPWPVEDDRAGFLEGRLLPLEYGKIRQIAQQAPAQFVLSRHGGGWRLAAEDDGGGGAIEVNEGEVYRWIAQLRAAEIAPWPNAPRVETEFSHQLVITSDLGIAYRLDCGELPAVEGEDDGWVCRRDGGPLRRVVGTPPMLSFDARTFEDRTLIDARAMDARALELRPGAADSGGVRTSVRNDLGVWRLDAPSHPDMDGALDQVRLEALLAVVSTLRVQAWTDAVIDAPTRLISVTYGAVEDRPPAEFIIAVDDACRCAVDGGRTGRLDAQTCEALMGELLYDDPARGWLRESRTLEVRGDGPRLVARASNGAWRVDAPGEAAARNLREQLERLQGWRSSRLVAVDPERTEGARWLLRRDGGPDLTLYVTPTQLHIAGKPWAYVGSAKTDDPRN